MGDTRIEWATKVWNPVTGCTPISPACEHCYAMRMANRLAGRFGYPMDAPFRVTLHPDRLDEPFHWKGGKRIFVCSMGDLFHDDVPDSFLDEVFFPFYTLEDNTFILLTKRWNRMKAYLDQKTPLGRNVWGGVSIWNQESADEAIPVLLQTKLEIRIVSLEPGLGPVDLVKTVGQAQLNMDRLGESLGPHWVICGGETGPGARPMNPDWPRSLRDQCLSAQVPFFFKQWGEYFPCALDNKDDPGTPWRTRPDGPRAWGFSEALQPPETWPQVLMLRVGKKAAGYLLDGHEWKEFPK